MILSDATGRNTGATGCNINRQKRERLKAEGKWQNGAVRNGAIPDRKPSICWGFVETVPPNKVQFGAVLVPGGAEDKAESRK